MFKSIVIAFDGSPHAGKALELAAQMAREQKAGLGIIYVVDRLHTHVPEEMRQMAEVEHLIDPRPKMMVNFENAPATMMSSMAQTSADTQDALYQYADFLVEQAKKNAKQAGAGEIETRVAQGDPAEETVAFARDRDADLIICGSRGFGKLKSVLLGSVSHKIAQLAACSCLTVK